MVLRSANFMLLSQGTQGWVFHSERDVLESRFRGLGCNTDFSSDLVRTSKWRMSLQSHMEITRSRQTHEGPVTFFHSNLLSRTSVDRSLPFEGNIPMNEQFKIKPISWRFDGCSLSPYWGASTNTCTIGQYPQTISKFIILQKQLFFTHKDLTIVSLCMIQLGSTWRPRVYRDYLQAYA